MMKHYKSFLIMFFLFSSFSQLQVMGEEEQTVVPKPFAEFLSENMKKTDGTFPVYQEGNRVYMEFPRKWNGREIEVSGQIDRGFGMINRSVKSLGVVRLAIPDSMSVEFLQPFYAERIMDRKSTYWDAFRASNVPVAGVEYPAVAISQDGNPIIDITDVVKGEKEWVSYSQYPDVRSLDPDMSKLNSVQVISPQKGNSSGREEVVLKVVRYHEAESEQYAFNSMAIILPNGSKPLYLSICIRLLPEEDMPIRLATEGLDIQTIHFKDYSQNPYTVVDDSLVMRLHPNNACTVYVDSLVPNKYKEALQKGILSWNESLAKAKVKLRIHLNSIKPGIDAASVPFLVSYDMGKVGVSSQKTVHPRTGEILSFRMNIGHDFKKPLSPVELQKLIHQEFGQVLGLSKVSDDAAQLKALSYLYSAQKSRQVYQDREIITKK